LQPYPDQDRCQRTARSHDPPRSERGHDCNTIEVPCPHWNAAATVLRASEWVTEQSSHSLLPLGHAQRPRRGSGRPQTTFVDTPSPLRSRTYHTVPPACAVQALHEVRAGGHRGAVPLRSAGAPD